VKQQLVAKEMASRRPPTKPNITPEQTCLSNQAFGEVKPTSLIQRYSSCPEMKQPMDFSLKTDKASSDELLTLQEFIATLKTLKTTGMSSISKDDAQKLWEECKSGSSTTNTPRQGVFSGHSPNNSWDFSQEDKPITSRSWSRPRVSFTINKDDKEEWTVSRGRSSETFERPPRSRSSSSRGSMSSSLPPTKNNKSVQSRSFPWESDLIPTNADPVALNIFVKTIRSIKSNGAAFLTTDEVQKLWNESCKLASMQVKTKDTELLLQDSLHTQQDDRISLQLRKTSPRVSQTSMDQTRPRKGSFSSSRVSSLSSDEAVDTSENFPNQAQKIKYRHCKTLISPPLFFDGPSACARSGSVPKAYLVPDHVYGYTPKQEKANLFVGRNGDFVAFTVASVAIIQPLQNGHPSGEQKFFSGHTSQITCLAIDRSGELGATGQLGKSCWLSVWFTEDCTEHCKIGKDTYERGFAQAMFSNQSKVIVTLGMDQRNLMVVWDIATGTQLHMVNCVQGSEFDGSVYGIALSPREGHYMSKESFVTVGLGNHIKFWSLDIGLALRACPKLPGRLQNGDDVNSILKGRQGNFAKLKEKTGDFFSAVFSNWSSGPELCFVGSDLGLVIIFRDTFAVKAISADGSRHCIYSVFCTEVFLLTGCNEKIKRWSKADIDAFVEGTQSTLAPEEVIDLSAHSPSECLDMQNPLQRRERTSSSSWEHNLPPRSARQDTNSKAFFDGSIRKTSSIGDIEKGGSNTQVSFQRFMHKANSDSDMKHMLDSIEKADVKRQNNPCSIRKKLEKESFKSSNPELFGPGGKQRRRALCFHSSAKVTDLQVITMGKDGYSVVYGTSRAQIGTVELGVGGFSKVWLQGHTSFASGVAAHPCLDDVFVTVGDDEMLKIWRTTDKTLLKEKKIAFKAKMADVSPDGSQIAVAGCENKIAVFCFNTLACEIFIQEGNSPEEMRELKYSPDGKLLAVGSHDNFIYVYDVQENYTLKVRLNGHSSFITHLDWSSDSRYLQSNCGAYEILYWDVLQGKSMSSIADFSGADIDWETWTSVLGFPVMGIWHKEALGGEIKSVDRSKDKKTLVVSDDKGGIKIFNCPCVNANAAYRRYQLHSSFVMSVRFLKSDSYIISAGGSDCALIQWKFKRGCPPKEEKQLEMKYRNNERKFQEDFSV